MYSILSHFHILFSRRPGCDKHSIAFGEVYQPPSDYGQIYDKNPRAGDPKTTQIAGGLLTLCLISEILTNSYIVWYFLFGMPASCVRLAEITCGRETCEAGSGTPFIVLISAVLIIARFFILYRIHSGKNTEKAST